MVARAFTKSEPRTGIGAIGVIGLHVAKVAIDDLVTGALDDETGAPDDETDTNECEVGGNADKESGDTASICV